jgi:N-acetyl-anhydromuramyl-L-alanine amidase AmpD
VSGTVSNEFAGVELQAAGQLAKFGNDYFPWWDRDPKTKQYQRLDKNKIPAREVIQVTKREGNLATGYYHAYTMEQMMMLRVLCVWLHLNNPDVFSIDRVVGHDEVSPGRKVDPGGALWWGRKGEATERLPMTMAEFRDLLWRDVAAVQKNQNQK